jgi:hypothetical protein
MEEKMKKSLLSQGLFVGAISLLSTSILQAGVSKDLVYPTGVLKNGKDIMNNVYFVNHFFAFKNYSIQKQKRTITVIVKRSEGKKPLTETVERYLNNDYNNGKINSKDLAIFRSGKMKGTGMLITDYKDDAKSQEYLLWLPALRKIRRFAQPAHDDSWGGTDFTFGDVTLRKPKHETHELMATETFGKTINSMIIAKDKQTRTTKNLPAPTDEFKNREVYKVKSTTKFSNWWYDYRITYVDTKTFADYRTEYYKNKEQIKFLDKNWQKFEGQTDPRAQRWYSWYGKNLKTNHDSMAFIPKKVTSFNDDKFKVGGKKYTPERLWSKKTLTKIKR